MSPSQFSHSPDDLRLTLDRLITLELGFAWWGIAPAEPVDEDHADALRAWLAAGRHGEMGWLANHVDLRLDPRKVLPDARSIIVVADRYAPREDESTAVDGGAYDDAADEGRATATATAGRELDAKSVRATGRIARYARGDDYHLRMKKRLIRLADRMKVIFPQEHFRTAVDTAPLLERDHAVRAGLGYIGKNTLTIRPGETSYFFLGEVLTTCDLPHSAPVRTDHCGTCQRCVDTCPTGALDRPYTLDASKCISYLTIEHRSPIDPRYHEAIGDWIFGCDICQEVCPHNGGQPRPAPPFATPRLTREPGDGRVGDPRALRSAGLPPVQGIYAARRAGFDLLEVLGWTEEDRRQAFVTSALKRAKLDMMKRNAIIAAGNFIQRSWEAGELTREELESPGSTEAALLLRRIAELAASSNPDASYLVQETARVTHERINRVIRDGIARPHPRRETST